MKQYYIKPRQTQEAVKRRINYDEDRDAMRLAGYLLMLQRQGKISVYSHIPHETYTKSWNVKRKNKLKGVRAGVPDYIIVIKGRVVFLELKREKGGVVSQDQKEWLAAVDDKLTVATVAKGYQAAKDFIDRIIERNEN